MLAPVKHQKVLSFVTGKCNIHTHRRKFGLRNLVGWLAVIGWQAALAASSFMTGQMIQSLAILGHQLSYHALPWQGTLIIWATLSLSLTVNLIGGKLLPRIEVVVLVLHILGFFAIMITLVYMAEPNTAKEVFTTFQNGGGFSTQALSWFVGMTGSAFGFAGGDGVVHVGFSFSLLVSFAKIFLLTIQSDGRRNRKTRKSDPQGPNAQRRHQRLPRLWHDNCHVVLRWARPWRKIGRDHWLQLYGHIHGSDELSVWHNSHVFDCDHFLRLCRHGSFGRCIETALVFFAR